MRISFVADCANRDAGERATAASEVTNAALRKERLPRVFGVFEVDMKKNLFERMGFCVGDRMPNFECNSAMP